MLWQWHNDCHVVMRRYLQDKVTMRLEWFCLGRFPFLLLKLTNIFIVVVTQSRNWNFFELLDAYISTFRRIYLGHGDFNSLPLTFLTFSQLINSNVGWVPGKNGSGREQISPVWVEYKGPRHDMSRAACIFIIFFLTILMFIFLG